MFYSLHSKNITLACNDISRLPYMRHVISRSIYNILDTVKYATERRYYIYCGNKAVG